MKQSSPAAAEAAAAVAASREMCTPRSLLPKRRHEKEKKREREKKKINLRLFRLLICLTGKTSRQRELLHALISEPVGVGEGVSLPGEIVRRRRGRATPLQDKAGKKFLFSSQQLQFIVIKSNFFATSG